MTGIYSRAFCSAFLIWKDVPKLTRINFLCVLLVLCCFIQTGFGQTTILTAFGATYTNTDGPTGPDIYSVNVSQCTSVSFSLDYSFSLPWEGSGNMEMSTECPFGPPDCDGDPNFPSGGSCANCWDFLWAVFNLDGLEVGSGLIGDAGTTNAEQAGTISSNNICTNGAATADITVVTQTWAMNESVTFSNIMIVCYEAAPTITTNAPFCSGNDLDLMGSATDVSSVVSWLWTNDGSGTIANPNAQNTTSSNPQNGETYTLTVTDPVGCTGTASETVGVVSAPTASISVNPTSACSGETVNITFTGTPGATVTYFDGFANQTITLNGGGTANASGTVGGSDLTLTLVDITLGNCTASLSQSVTVTLEPPPVVNSISVSPSAVCDGGIAIFDIFGTPNATVTYFDGSSNQMVVLDGSGSASIPVPVSNTDITFSLVNVSLGPCSASANGSATVTAIPLPTATVSVSPTSACEGEVAVFTFIGTPDAIIGYFNGSNNTIIFLDGSGIATESIILGPGDLTYDLIDADLMGCAQSLAGSATVMVAAPPTASLSANPTAACEGDNISFTFSGTPNSTINYNNGAGNQSIVLDASGSAVINITIGATDTTYTLIDVTLGGCFQNINQAVTVTSTSAPSAGLSVAPSSVCEGDTVIFTFSGTPNATLTYDNGIGVQNINLDAAGNASDTLVTGSIDSTYILTNAALNGCSQVLDDSATVTIIALPTATIAAAPTSVCEGDTVIFTFSGTANATVIYFDGTANQNIILDGSGNGLDTLIASTNNTTFTLVDISLNGCSQALSDAVTVTVTPLPTATISAAPLTACEGDDVTFTITGTPNATVTYSNGSANQIVILDAAGNASFTITTNATDTTFTLVDIALGLCTQALSDAVTVTLTAAPTASLSVLPTTACEGESVIFTFSGTPNATVTYFDGNSNQNVLLDGSGGATVSITTGASDSTFTLVDVVLGSCSQTLSGTATVSILPTPTANISVAPVVACEGDDVTFSFTGTPNADIVYFDGTANQVITLDATGNATVTITTTNSDITYTLVGVAFAGCSQTLSEAATATVSLVPTANINIVNSFCEGEDVTFTFSGTPNATVTYNDGNTNQDIVLDGNGDAAVTFTAGTSNITYTLVEVILGACSQILSENATAIIEPLPNADVTVSPPNACEGDDVTFTFTGTPFAIVVYDGGPVPGVQLDALGNATVTLTAGTTDITFTITETGSSTCLGTFGPPATVTVTPLPTASLSVAPATACEGEDVTFTFTGTPNATINYNDGSTNQTIVLDASGNATASATAQTSNITYTLVDATLNACTQNLTETATVTITSSPTANISVAPTTACEGDDVTFTFTGTPNATINYDDGTGPQSIILDASGNATSNVTTAVSDITFTLLDVLLGNCLTALNTSATVTVNPLPIANPASIAACNDGTGQATFDLTALEGTIGSGTVLWYLDDMAQSPLNTPDSYPSGNGTVYATLIIAGCVSEPVAITLSLDELPTFNAVTDDCTATNLDYVVTFNISGGSAPYTLSGDAGTLVGNLFTSDPISIGTAYSFMITDDNGCGPVEVSGVNLQCDCVSSAGDMNLTTIDACADDMVSATHLANELLDGDDVLFFVLHDNAGNTLGTIYAINNTPDFDLSAIGGLLPNTLYYISAVAGNDDGLGSIDFSDNCLSVSQGTPLIIHDQPDATVQTNAIICPDDCTDVLVTLSGTPPFSVDYQVNHPILGIQTFTENTNNNFFNVTVCGNGAEDASILINLLSVNDQFCTSALLSPAAVVTVANNLAVGSEVYSGCIDDGYSVLVNGNLYSQATQTGTEVLMNYLGCDSTVTINLVFDDVLTGEELYNGCIGDGYSVMVGANLFNEGNPTGTETIPSSGGCDSIVTINLTFDAALTGEELYTGCDGDGYSVIVNGNTYNQGTPTGTETVTSTSGCDSIVTINLVFNNLLTGEETYDGCEGDGYFVLVGGNIYDEATSTGTETVMSSIGCDSTISINLSFTPTLFGNELYNGCTGDGYSIVVNGNTYNQGTPTGTETLAASTGCDSIVSINLTFNDALSGNELYDGCNGDGYSVMVGGNIYNEGNPAGTETVVSSIGCDSIVTINLSFNDALSGNEEYNGCVGDGYSVSVNGTLYNEGNQTGVQTLTSTIGCDSVVVINLIYNPPTTGEESHDGCLGDGYSVLVNGNLYSEGNPDGTETLVNSIGCDSIVTIDLNFNAALSGTETYSGCLGDGYQVIVNGTPYNEGNQTGMETLTSNSGCDSIVTINLTFNTFLSGEEVYTGCEGDGYSVMVNGNIYDQNTPVGSETITSPNSCDSIVSINLVYNPAVAGNEAHNGCSGDGYAILVNGNIYNEASPSGIETLTSSTGCDSIVTIDLVFNDILLGNETYTGCSGDGYFVMVGGDLYDEGNQTGMTTLTSSGGCDSIVNINLTFNDAVTGEELYLGCNGDGYSVSVNGSIYNETTPTGMETLTSSIGCDSIVTIDLTFNTILNGTETYTGCQGDGYSVMVNGNLYNEGNQSGIEVLTSSTACDSIVTINLAYNPATNGTASHDGCEGDGYSILINGNVYDEGNPTGTELLPGANYLGCDSIVDIALNFTDEVVFNLSGLLCDDDFVVVNGTIYDFGNPSGSETILGGSIFGCDSTVVVNLAFYPLVTASISAAPSICPGDSTVITFSLNGGNSYDVLFDNGGTIINLNGITDGYTLTVSPSVTTIYTLLDVADLSIPCDPLLQNSSVTINVSNISVSTQVQTDFDGFSVSCNEGNNGIALAIGDNGEAPYTYQWDNGASTASTENLAAGVYLVTVTDAIGCTATGEVFLTEPPAVQLLTNSTIPTCFGYDDGTIVIDTIWGGSGPYEFSIDGQFYSGIDSFPYSIPNLSSGQYDLSIQDMNDCINLYNTTISSPPLNTIDIGPDQEIILGESYTITSASNFLIDTFYWSPLEWLSCDTCLRPVVQPQYTTTYMVQAVDSVGCSAFDEIMITVLKPRAVFIPNAFSPDGDGKNDRFTIFSDQEVAQINYLRIFDRWGEQVFQQDDFQPNDERVGWDGRFKNKDMQVGVFVYVAEVTFVDGLVLLYKGDLTLLR